MASKTYSIFDPAIVYPAIGESFLKLNPLTLAKKPVIFVAEVGAAISTILLVTGRGANFGLELQIAI
jgi:K+-transporting ATPase ATPase B chain